MDGRNARVARRGSIEIEAPFGDVAVHVVQAPCVGFLQSDRMRLVAAVLEMPGMFIETFRIVAKMPGRRGAGAAGVFPFRLGGQTIEMPGFGAEPTAILPRGKLRHVDRRSPARAHAEVGLDVTFLRMRDRDARVVAKQCQVLELARIRNVLPRDCVTFKFIPGHLGLAHPEGVDSDGALRTFVDLALGLIVRAAHLEGPRGNGKHVECYLAAGEFLGEWLEGRRWRFGLALHNALANGAGDFHLALPVVEMGVFGGIEREGSGQQQAE